MVDNSCFPSLGNSETYNQQSEDIIRQGYTVRVSNGQEVIVPTALDDVEVPLARMNKPDFTQAVNMEVGVSNALDWS
jgi:hypothetical protein